MDKQEWESEVNSKNLVKALIDHFSYLSQKKSDATLLELIMEKSERAVIENGTLRVYFKNQDEPFSATPPMNDIPNHFPESYKACLRHHQTITFKGSTLGEDDSSNIDGYEEELEELGAVGKEFANSKRLICPFNADGAYYLIYHPSKKRKDGSPQLYFVIPHDLPEISPLTNTEEEVAASFLQIVAHQLGLHFSEDV